MQTQKERIQTLQNQIQLAKSTYSNSLRNLEKISEEIHKKRGDLNNVAPSGPREPGVGAELCLPLPDFNLELDKCEIRSIGQQSLTTSTAVSEKGDDDGADVDDQDLNLELLRQKVKTIAIRPVEGGDGQQEHNIWENELNATVNKLDHLMMLKETSNISPASSQSHTQLQQISLPTSPIKKLMKSDPLPLLNVSMNVLPTSSSLLTSIISDANQTPKTKVESMAAVTSQNNYKKPFTEKRRKLSLQ